MTRGMFTVPQGRRIYGMQLPIQAQSAYFVADWERTAGPKELGRLARLATTMDTPTLGYATMWRFPKQLLVEWARTGPTRLPHSAGSLA